MSDIVERLRDYPVGPADMMAMFKEAADEVERLRAAARPTDVLLGSARVQLQRALRLAERDGSDLVSVPLSVAELRATLTRMQP